jgi:hypothetical protein
VAQYRHYRKCGYGLYRNSTRSTARRQPAPHAAGGGKGQEENTADQPPRLCASAEPNPPSGGTSSSSARPRPAALKAAVYVSRLCVGAVGSAGTGEHP